MSSLVRSSSFECVLVAIWYLYERLYDSQILRESEVDSER